jgi:hypothetical protein
MRQPAAGPALIQMDGKRPENLAKNAAGPLTG